MGHRKDDLLRVVGLLAAAHRRPEQDWPEPGCSQQVLAHGCIGYGESGGVEAHDHGVPPPAMPLQHQAQLGQQHTPRAGPEAPRRQRGEGHGGCRRIERGERCNVSFVACICSRTMSGTILRAATRRVETIKGQRRRQGQQDGHPDPRKTPQDGPRRPRHPFPPKE